MASPSGCKTYKACPRKWALGRGQQRTDASRDAGTWSHFNLEMWLKFRIEVPEADKKTRLALGHIPRPEDALAEQRFDFEHEGVPHSGMVDWLTDYRPGDSIRIGDLKTTSDASRWASYERDDEQRVCYSFWAMRTFDVQWVFCDWVYTDGETVNVVTIAYERQEILDRFATYHETLAVPVEQNAKTDASLMPRSLGDACMMYRGCEYMRECWSDMPSDEQFLWALRLNRSRIDKE